MTKYQMSILPLVIAYFGTREFTEKEWKDSDSPACGRLSLGMALHDGIVIEHKVVTRNYYTVAEIVEKLNDCAGEYCYFGNWEYKIDESGRVYDEDVTVTYHMA